MYTLSDCSTVQLFTRDQSIIASASRASFEGHGKSSVTTIISLEADANHRVNYNCPDLSHTYASNPHPPSQLHHYQFTSLLQLMAPGVLHGALGGLE